MRSTVSGGFVNQALGTAAAVGGGSGNRAQGDAATVPGGLSNQALGDYSFAAGRRARAVQDGAFVWADSTNENFDSTVQDQFRTRAGGGVEHVVGDGAWRIEPAQIPNIVAGWSGNQVDIDAIGATIAGGGCPNTGSVPCDGDQPNEILSDFGTIGGGVGNRAGSRAVVGGGYLNQAVSNFSVIAGGSSNIANSIGATVGGGTSNQASSLGSTVPGGRQNLASGRDSFAAGFRARAEHTGSFVWADSTNADFESTGNDQFLIGASGGVGINKNDPQSALDVAGTITSDQLDVAGTITSEFLDVTSIDSTQLNVAGAITSDQLTVSGAITTDQGVQFPTGPLMTANPTVGGYHPEIALNSDVGYQLPYGGGLRVVCGFSPDSLIFLWRLPLMVSIQ